MPYACPERRRAAQAAWRARNRDKLRKYFALYRTEHRAKIANNYRRWREANPERASEIGRASYRRHREERLRRQRAIRQTPDGRAKEVAKQRRWRAENPERLLLQQAKKNIARDIGILFRHVPDGLARARACQMAVISEIRGRRNK